MSIEAPIMVTSSSPLSIFARSQTPIEFSPRPTASDSTRAASLQQIRVSQQCSFKTTQCTRRGFSPAFTSAKAALGARSGVENVPLCGSPSKFETTPPGLGVARSETPGQDPTPVDPRYHLAQQSQWRHAASWDDVPECSTTVVRVLPSDARKKKVDRADPFQWPKATSRRTDWTPTKLDDKSSGFGLDLAKAFGHSEESSFEQRTSSDGGLTKRRKIGAGIHGPAVSKKPTSQPLKPRNKSPAKRNVTITGLATSHFDQAQDEQSPMAQFLVSTQANRAETTNPETFQIDMKAKKLAKKKTKKSRLASPETVQRTLDRQDFIFATSSQLLRDESPTLLKDTIEAIKVSEEDHEILPTQQSTTLSAEGASPKRFGLAKVKGKRNMWSAACRDGNDALLHVNSVFDLPDMKDAFIGEDAQIEHAVSLARAVTPVDSLSLLQKLNDEAADALKLFQGRDSSDEKSRSRVASSSTLQAMTSEVDKVTIPPLQRPQIRPYSTTYQPPDSQRTKLAETHHQPIPKSPASASANSVTQKDRTKSKPPAKPNYNLWSDERLKGEVKRLGFKRLRARKSMIDKLDDYYAQQYGLDPKKVKAATKAAQVKAKTLQQDDILGKVHAFADRPVPRQKKQPRKKKETRSVVVSDDVVDISDIDTSALTTWDRLQKITIPESEDELFDPEPPASTAPIKGTGVQAKRKKELATRPLTPLPTKLPESTQQSSPGFDEPEIEVPETSSQISSATTGEVDLKSQIRRALLEPPPNMATRNQQAQPTWHQKILMYGPIVLEDFTTWLNTEGFNQINEDREIGADSVKEWCHENGICCLWKGGWRGNRKKGRADGQ